MLLIHIPTFNRWDRLVIQLSLLRDAHRLGAVFSVDIFDNGSTDGTVEKIALLGLPEIFRVHASPSNVGFEGNVMRILGRVEQIARAEDHLWILSDDDFINPVALMELTRDSTLPAGELVLLSFLQWRGRGVGLRPCNGVLPEILRRESGLFGVLTDATLISGWLYPCGRLAPGLAALRAGFGANAFLQLVLLAHTLVQTAGFVAFSRPIGVEYPTSSQRFKLKETWAIDRPAALAEACRVLGLAPSLAERSTRFIARTFFRRAVAAAVRGDSQAAASSCEALEEFARRGYIPLPPALLRGYGWAARCLARALAPLRLGHAGESPVAAAARAFHAYHRPAASYADPLARHPIDFLKT